MLAEAKHIGEDKFHIAHHGEAIIGRNSCPPRSVEPGGERGAHECHSRINPHSVPPSPRRQRVPLLKESIAPMPRADSKI
jgi:hypothetical protein